MEGIPGKRFLASIWCFTAFSVVGCADFGNVPRWLVREEAPTTLPGVIAPAERIAHLRELAEEGPKSGPEQRQRVAGELAEAIRREEDPLVRAEIIRTLGEYPSATADRVLGAAMDDPDADARVAACRAWAKRGGPEAIALLGRALNDDADVDVRLAAARGLGETKDHAAVAALGPALADKDPAMQYRAVLSLRKITGQDLGNDVGRWQQYVRGETPIPARPVSIAQRLRELF